MYLLYRNYGRINFKEIELENEKTYRLVGIAWPQRFLKDDDRVIATVETHEQAVHMQQVLSGIEGEYTRRQQVADKECQARYLKAREARDAAVKQVLAREI